MKKYHEELIDEIVKLISDNLNLLYKYDEDSLINLRKHCYKNYDKDYKSIPYIQLLGFVDEALADIFNAPYIYDFREL